VPAILARSDRAGEGGKCIESFCNGKGITDEIKQLCCKQTDDFGLNVMAAGLEFSEQPQFCVETNSLDIGRSRAEPDIRFEKQR
jgi:hypothetical protein